MLKTLTFDAHLVPLILNGSKTTTWRLFDDKDLQSGDRVEFLGRPEKKSFALAKIIEVIEKRFQDLDETDWVGHEKFSSDDEMYRWYSEAYKAEVGPGTLLKIVHFEIKDKIV